MVNKCSPIKLSMVLYCCGGLFDPGPALPGQNGDCSQLMDPATTPNYQQAAGTLQCGERDRNWWKCLFQLSIRTELSWWIHCLSVSGSASSISNIKFPLYSAVRVPSALLHDDDLININMHMHSALQLQLQCTPEMQFNPAEGKLRSAQTHSVEQWRQMLNALDIIFVEMSAATDDWQLHPVTQFRIFLFAEHWAPAPLCILILTERNFQLPAGSVFAVCSQP